MTFARIVRGFAVPLITSTVLVSVALAQSDTARQTVAITYPLDETVTVKFRRGESSTRRSSGNSS